MSCLPVRPTLVVHESSKVVRTWIGAIVHAVTWLAGDAMKKFETLPRLRALFAQGGVRDDYAMIHTAVVQHSQPKELSHDHPHCRLTSLLKDADGLDRVRLGDLDPRYLRNPQARDMVGFAEALFDETDGIVPIGHAHFAALWPEAVRLLGAG